MKSHSLTVAQSHRGFSARTRPSGPFVCATVILALQFGSLLTGAIITEQIFSWPGLGRLLIPSITTRDYPQVQASVLVIAIKLE
jgi:ABC-type dipeptide/oligopeptide/nickel transport system permease component